MKHIQPFKTFNELIQEVSEGLIKTNDLLSTINSLKYHFSDFKFKFKFEDIDYEKQVFKLKISDVNYILNIKSILEVISSLTINLNGYFPKYIEITERIREINEKWNDSIWDYIIKNSNNIIDFTIHFQAKFDEIINIESDKYII